MDGSFYLILTAVPLRAAEMGAAPAQLGILPVLGSGVYVAAAMFFGRLSDRISRIAMARVGAWVRVAVALGLTRATSVHGMMLWMPALGVANGLFWPALQAALGEMRPEQELGRNLGRFNVSWSSGKMLGFLCGGLVITRAGYGAALILAAALTAAVAVLLPGVKPSPAVLSEEPGTSQEERRGSALRRHWRWIGWLSNFVLFGIGATLNYQYPKLLITIGFTGQDFGVYLAMIYLFQTLSFLLFTRWRGWHFRLGPLLAAHGAALLSVVAVGWLRNRWLIWATAPGIGVGLGLSYSSSIYYSLFRESGRGRNTGVHEALLGTGTFLLPLLGGIAAQLSGSLITPYLLCAAVLAAAMAVESALGRRAGRIASGI